MVGVVGATFAYFTSSATLTNEFETGTYSTSVTEEFVSPDNWTPGTTTAKKVNVTNNGSVDVAVRAKYTEKWTAKNGTVLSGTRNGEKVAQFNIGSDWEKATDGFYYYKGTLTNGQTSSDFISSVTFNPNFILEEGTDIECTTTKVNGKTTVNCESLTTGYAGATYSLDITIETIQADKKWDYTVSTSTPTPTLISFSINGTAYQAEEGMSWEEWVNSEYNTVGAIVKDMYGDGLAMRININSEVIRSMDYSAVEPNDKIEVNAEYGNDAYVD